MEGTVPMPAQWCTSSRPKRVWLLHIQPFSLYFPAAIYVFDCSKLKDQRNLGKGRVPLLPAVVLTMVKAVGLPSKCAPCFIPGGYVWCFLSKLKGELVACQCPESTEP